jgi:excisionase family DNA binding protein
MTNDILQDTFHRFELRLERLDTKLDSPEKRLASLEGRLDTQFDGLENRLNTNGELGREPLGRHPRHPDGHAEVMELEGRISDLGYIAWPHSGSRQESVGEPTNWTRNPPMDELLTVQEVADELRLTCKTVYRYLRQGQLRGQKLGRIWRVSRSDLTVYLNARRVD